jgi:serine/threonine-protein kinase RsbW
VAPFPRRRFVLKFVLQNNCSAEKQRLLSALELFARDHSLSAEARHAADLALEEHLTNIFSHGSGGPGPVEVHIRVELRGGTLQVEIRDEGRPFDPTLHPAPDLTVPLEQRPVGGLGIHMMRTVMDELHYRREGGSNVLVMRKRL